MPDSTFRVSVCSLAERVRAASRASRWIVFLKKNRHRSCRMELSAPAGRNRPAAPRSPPPVRTRNPTDRTEGFRTAKVEIFCPTAKITRNICRPKWAARPFRNVFRPFAHGFRPGSGLSRPPCFTRLHDGSSGPSRSTTSTTKRERSRDHSSFLSPMSRPGKLLRKRDINIPPR